MPFNSVLYLAFLPLVFTFTFNFPQRIRVPFLLLASYAFYSAWNPVYTLVLLFLTVVDFFAALAIARAGSISARRAYWLCSLAANLGILFSFKLAAFADASLLLPLGLSIHTLQAISYTTDVYRRAREPERNFARFALFIAWFPQLTAGPIERAGSLLPQLSAINEPRAEELREAVALILGGFFQKLVIADNLLPLVAAGYERHGTREAAFTLLAVYAFAFQLYYDFRGYTDIARGSSLLFGVRLRKNFDQPFLSTSVPEFWRRWHISLTSWFFEYVYFPVAKAWRNPTLAVLVTFLLAGIWHGFGAKFLIWGGLNGLLYCAYVFFSPRLPVAGWGAWLARLFVFHQMALCWIFFRVKELGDVPGILLRCADALAHPLVAISDLLGSNQVYLMGRAGLGLAVLLFGWRAGLEITRLRGWRFGAVLVSGIVAILALGRFSGEEFIYFQF